MKVALVYDRVNKWGGAERVLLALHEMYPEAPLYTSTYNDKKASWAKIFPKIYTSFLQRIPFVKHWHEGFGWLMPFIFESFNFDNYDLVISVTSEAAKGIITKPHTKHICYCLTPTRYLWSHYDLYFKNRFLRFISKPFINYLRSWDKVAAFRPDKIIAISNEVKERIKKYYGRDSQIVFPPVDINKTESRIKKSDRGYFLVVSRLVPYKRVDLVVKAFNRLKLPLVIVGSGSSKNKLKQIANRNIRFVGQVTDSELIKYYQGAKALVISQLEDFGIVSVEAQMYGVPVIAFKGGGVEDTVINNVTGIFFLKQEVDSLALAVAQFMQRSEFERPLLFTNAERFSKETFFKSFSRAI